MRRQKWTALTCIIQLFRKHLQFHSLYLNQDKWVCFFFESCKIGSCRVCKCSMLYGFELMLRVCKWTWWTGWTQRDFVSVVPTLTRALTFPSASILQSVHVSSGHIYLTLSYCSSLSSSAAHYEKPVYVQISSEIHCEAGAEKRWGRGCGRQGTEWRKEYWTRDYN